MAYAPNCERARAINTAIKRAIIFVPLLRNSKSEGRKGYNTRDWGNYAGRCVTVDRSFATLKNIPKYSFVKLKSAVNGI